MGMGDGDVQVSEWTLEALTRIKKTQLLRESIERKKAASTCVLDRLFDKADDVGVPTALALVLAQVNEGDRRSTAYDIKHALFDAGKHDLCAMVESWLVGDEARSDEEEKQRYREIAAKRLERERYWEMRRREIQALRTGAPDADEPPSAITPERVEHLAAHMRREADRDIAKSIRADNVREALDVDMRPASELPLEPPVVLERKALNQLDKRAKTRKLAGPKEQNDENEHRQYHEKKEQRELRNAQTKARNQKRAKARAKALALTPPACSRADKLLAA